MIKNKFRSAFTIVELIVVISVIAILAAIVLVSYGAWRTSTATSSLKSDLGHVASAMESSRTFSGTYPLVIPSTFTASASNTITLTLPDPKSFCLDGTTSISSSVKYYIDNLTQANGATPGTCATRVAAAVAIPPTSVTVVSATGSQVSLAWPAVAGAASYTAQCATDPTFIYGLQQTTLTSTVGSTVSAMLSGLKNLTTFYCRVNAISSAGTSPWTVATANSTTTNAYSSIAIGTSIEGYWTSPPQGFLAEDGSAVSRTTYPDLYAVIGTTYGTGDGSTTFNLPDSRGRTVVNQNSVDPEFATVGQTYGAKTDIQTVPQLPSHTHTQDPHSHTLPVHASGSEASGYGLVASGYFTNRVYVTGSTGISTDTATNQNTGLSNSHNIIQPSIVKSFAIKYSIVESAASTLPVATSTHGYWASAPTDYLLEDGSAVSRTTYSVLFAAIGTTYGSGDGSTTFNLPDSRGRASVNISASDSEFNTMGEKYGEKAHTMTVLEMPSHTHIQNAHSHSIGFYWSGNEASPYGINSGGTGFGDRVIVGNSAMGISTTTASNLAIGGSASETVIQPSVVQKSAIKYTAAVTGIYNAVATGTSVPGYWASIPAGYLVENGMAVSRTTYSDLFSLVGTTYGAGDGSTTFNLPDSRGRVGVNLSSIDVEFNTIGEKYGEKTHLMTIAEMASHTHLQNSHTHVAGLYPSGSEASGYGASTPGQGFGGRLIVTGGGTATSSTIATNQSTGGGQAFNVIQPSIVKQFIIKY